MAVTVTNVSPDTTVIDITVDKISKHTRNILFLITGSSIVVLTGLGAWLYLSAAHSCVQNCNHGSSHGSGSGVSGAIAGPLAAAMAARYRVKKITLSPVTIEFERVVAKLSKTVTVSEIESCIFKRQWGGAFKITFAIKSEAKKIVINTTKALTPILKAELQKRYSFPIIEAL